ILILHVPSVARADSITYALQSTLDPINPLLHGFANNGPNVTAFLMHDPGQDLSSVMLDWNGFTLVAADSFDPIPECPVGSPNFQFFQLFLGNCASGPVHWNIQAMNRAPDGLPNTDEVDTLLNEDVGRIISITTDDFSPTIVGPHNFVTASGVFDPVP